MSCRGGRGLAGVALAIAIAFGCGAPPKQSKPKRVGVSEPTSDVQRGKASWYGGSFHGGPTASGERYDKRTMTAAHRTLPFGTRVRVTNLKNGRTVTVRINNRGPYSKGRIIDLSEAAAERLGMIDAGVVPCTVERLR
ncbi:MAG: septal ring lytic transglycosylase RlpA family protein [Deltaproteobacteria bacterium]|nr:septal ring lytic transglycosylase RlpA family protein [Deltaproteobacteria bacterium]